MTESQVVNEFIAQGELRAQLRVQRQNLLELLAGRFPDAVTQFIQQQQSVELLHNWFKVAIRATLEEFMTVLKK